MGSKNILMTKLFLKGMLQPSHTDTEQRDHAEEVKKLRRKVQEKHEEEYQEALVREKNLVTLSRTNKYNESFDFKVSKFSLLSTLVS